MNCYIRSEGIGLSSVNICYVLGTNVIEVSRTEEKLEKAKELGVVNTVKMDEVNDIVKDKKY